jgi:hypothetical protein
VLELGLPHPLDSGDGGAGLGIGPDVRYNLLRPVLL